MTIQELIDKLEICVDKSREVRYYYDFPDTWKSDGLEILGGQHVNTEWWGRHYALFG